METVVDKKLYDKLIEYSQSDFYGFHMPGHKRNTKMLELPNPYQFDITEIDGFDNLHHAEGIIKESMEEAAKYYGSRRSFYLVNGSSCGNLSAIASLAKSGDKIIVGRNCHKSVWNAIELLNLKAEYIYPEVVSKYDFFGGYLIEEVESVIKQNRDAKAIVITSPTYQGIVSDVKAICEISHKYRIPVIVDAAHGAHFSISEQFPDSALKQGADIVIESLHKTLPALTQTAILHMNTDYVREEEIQKYLSIFQTSSPSYVFMASIEKCIYMMEREGERLANQLVKNINYFLKCSHKLQNIEIIGRNLIDTSLKKPNGVYDFDITKIIISVKHHLMTGKELCDLLINTYHLQMEMASREYVLAMTSICDDESGFERLLTALHQIDVLLEACKVIRMKEKRLIDKGNIQIESLVKRRNTKVMEIAEATRVSLEKTEFVGLKDLAQRVSADYIYLYPPGVPVMMPGEVINRAIAQGIEEYYDRGYEVVGIKDGKARVFKTN